MKKFLSIAFPLIYLPLFLGSYLHAQLPEPILPTFITPTHTIYVSATGSDTNNGTIGAPVATFQHAIQLIPFGGPNVYGEVIFLQGTYHPSLPLSQGLSDFSQGNSQKNISVRGIGVVNIYGDNTPSGSNLLWLRGSNIKVENIRLYQSNNAGLLLTNPDANGNYTTARTMHDVIIKNVIVNNTFSHSILSKLVSNLLYDSLEVLNGQQENTGTNGNCHWGSALRADYCKEVTIRDCRVYHNRGEGINIAASTNALIQSCTSFDNFAPNFYCIKSNKVIFRQNLSYNLDSIYWRNCQADNGGQPQVRKPSSGLSISNEIAYDAPNSACIESRSYENGLFSNKIADSIFIHNNIFILAPFVLTDDSQGDCFFGNHSNNFSNIYVENNTFIGDVASNHPYKNHAAAVNFLFDQTNFQGCWPSIDGRGAYRLENVTWKNNIVSLEASANGNSISPDFFVYGGRPCNGGLIQDKFAAANNLWHHNPSSIYDSYANTTIPNVLYGNSDQTRGQMPTACDPRLPLSPIWPNSSSGNQQFSLYHQAPVSSYIVRDFYGRLRHVGTSNVGAIEVDTVVGVAQQLPTFVQISPNPFRDEFRIALSQSIDPAMVKIRNCMGQDISFEIQGNENDYLVKLKEPSAGIYFLSIGNGASTITLKLVAVR